ncbi:class I SAM-dependent methyltransferase [Candidatus Woesearchaeota archaeon]|nr:class I SAM-dependent methyltransferase [Candidatus Woesearchaeota archaeon]
MTALEKSRVLKVYGDSANGLYDEFMMDYVHRLHPASRIAYKSLFRILSSHLEKTSGGSALEVGVGTGRNLHRYPENISFVGVDITPEMLNEAEKRAGTLGRKNARFYVKDAENLEFESNSFDVVVSTYTICVTSNPARVMEEMIKVAKPGGLIGIYDCKKANHNSDLLFDQEFLADTIRTAGLYYKGRPVVVYNLLSDLDTLVSESGLKPIDKAILEFSCEESLGMYILQK